MKRKKTHSLPRIITLRKPVEAAFKQYRIYKYLAGEKHHAARKAYCKNIERLVNQLPDRERFIIFERYMREDGDYTTDYSIYQDRMDPPVSEFTYYQIKRRAMYKLASMLSDLKEGCT